MATDSGGCGGDGTISQTVGKVPRSDGIKKNVRNHNAVAITADGQARRLS